MKFSTVVLAVLATLAAAQTRPSLAAQPCGVQCLYKTLAAAGCKPPVDSGPPPEPEKPEAGSIFEGEFDPGPPATYKRPAAGQPMSSATKQAKQQSRDCFCTAPGLAEQFADCVPKACAAVGGDPNILVKNFNRTCSKTAGFKPVSAPPTAAA